MSASKHEWENALLVIGIHIGTAESGCAFSLLSSFKEKKNRINGLDLLGFTNQRRSTTPSCLLLKPNRSFCEFGFKAMEKYYELTKQDEHRNWHFFDLFSKTLYDNEGLNLQTTIVDSEHRKCLAVDIFSEAIRFLKDRCLDAIRKPTPLYESEVYYVITTPAVWCETARSVIRQASKQAGIALDHLCVAHESQCAALYINTMLTEMDNDRCLIKKATVLTTQELRLSPWKTYMVVNLGGSTIDITLHGNTTDDKLQCVNLSTVGYKGKNNIYKNLEYAVFNLVGANPFVECRMELLEWFEYMTRKLCSWDGKSEFRFHLPENSNILSVSGELQKDIFKTVMRETVQTITDTIKTFIGQLRKRIDAILVVGEFASCKLVIRSINETFAHQVDAIIYPIGRLQDISSVLDGKLAVLNGSVLYGRDSTLIDTEIRGYTHGFDNSDSSLWSDAVQQQEGFQQQQQDKERLQQHDHQRQQQYSQKQERSEKLQQGTVLQKQERLQQQQEKERFQQRQKHYLQQPGQSLQQHQQQKAAFMQESQELQQQHSMQQQKHKQTLEQNMSSPEPHWKNKFLVVGIDIGTTHSGYVWSFKSDYESDITKVQTKRWLCENKLTTGKTPTCLLLKPDGSFCKFGYEAVKKYTDLVEEEEHQQWHYFDKFKMTLYEERVLTLATTVLDSEGRKFPAVDIFAESIRYLKDNFLDVIQAERQLIQDSDIYYVLTTPAIWSEKAKSFMRLAAEKAGISMDHLRIALEPECAAVYIQTLLTSSDYSAQQRPDATLCITRSPGLMSQKVEFNPGTTYMIADMGGGTVDITLHMINKDGKLQELETPNGGCWGSDNINKRIESFLVSLVDAKVFEEFRHDLREDYIEWLSDVEHKKCSWDGESNISLIVPATLLELHKRECGKNLSESLKQSPYTGQAVYKNSKIRIQKEMFEKFFTDTIKSTVDHIETLITRLDKKVDMILLVGGFADCSLMRRKFDERFADKVDAILYPTAEAVLAVLKGSVLYGRDPSLIDTRICRYTYGLDWNEEFDPKIHPLGKLEQTDGGAFCKDVFLKLIQKGDIVDVSSTSQLIEACPKYTCQEEIQFPFYRSETNLPPRFVDEEGCFPLGTLSVQLPPEDRKLDTCIKLKVMFGLTELIADATDSTGRKYSARFQLL